MSVRNLVNKDLGKSCKTTQPVGNAEIETKKAIATGRSREAAISVLMPRILGALETNGHAIHRRRHPPMLAAETLRFGIHLVPSRNGIEHHSNAVPYGDLAIVGYGAYVFGGWR